MKIKKFVRNHKKEIVLVVGGVAIGIFVGKRFFSYRQWIRYAVKHVDKVAVDYRAARKGGFDILIGTHKGKHIFCWEMTPEDAETFLNDAIEIFPNIEVVSKAATMEKAVDELVLKNLELSRINKALEAAAKTAQHI